MQQLSLFDFGEEAPKPEKKKKASESGVDHSELPNNKNDHSELKVETNAPVPAPPTSSNDEKASSVIPSVPTVLTTEEAKLEVSDQSTSPAPENDVNKNNIIIEEPDEASEKEHSSTSNIDLNGAGNDGQPYSEEDHKHEPPVNGTEPQDQAVSSISEAGSQTDLLNSSDNKPEEANEVLFSNDQIRVKNVVVKSINKEAGPASDNTEPTASPHIDHQRSYSPTSLGSELDTSFVPEELKITSEHPPKNQEFQGESKEEPLQNRPDQKDLSEDDIIIHSDQTEASSPKEVLNFATNDIDNQENAAVNPTKRPYYIEDKTVPVRKRGRKSFKEIDAEVDLINIPPDEELFQKQYYPISVVAKWFRVNNSLLRFWENEFKILKPKKNKKGDRFFRPEDVKNLQLIYYLLRQKKLTINGAIKHLKSYKEQTEVNMQLIQTLNDFKGFLLELRAATEK